MYSSMISILAAAVLLAKTDAAFGNISVQKPRNCLSRLEDLCA